MILNIENLANPEHMTRFTVEDLDHRVFNAIQAVEGELANMPSHPDMAPGQIYAFGTPEQKVREQDDGMSDFLLAAVDATMGGMTSMPTNAFSIAGEAMSFTSELSQSRRPQSEQNSQRDKKRANFSRKKTPKPAPQKAVKASGAKIKSKSQKDMKADQKREKAMARFNKTKSKRMDLEKAAHKLYGMREYLTEQKKKGIRCFDWNERHETLKPVALGAQPEFKPSMAFIQAMSPFEPTPGYV